MPFRRGRCRLPVNRTPSITHQREPNLPLPIPGCRCWECENARTDQDDRIGAVMGEPDEKAGES